MALATMSEERRLNRTVMLVSIGVVLLMAFTAVAAVGAAVYRYTNGGAIKSVRTATTTGDPWATSGETFIAISGSQASVSVPNGQKAVLIITFSTEYLCVGGTGYCSLAVYVDGQRVSPTEIILEYATGTTRSSSFQWISGKLGAGAHNISVAGHTTGNTTISLYSRTLTVLRAGA